ncbi:MAG TPA: hypothetical protein VFP20_06380 [Bacteroidales bacterium]|nr:hypothetical protein [Bacteroidales bacterium]
MKNILLATLLLIALFSCGREPDYKPDYFELNKTYDLSYGKYVFNKDGMISVRFDSVITDSRCPTGGICVTSGKAIVRFEITVYQYCNPEVDLTISEDTVISGYKFSFISLNPYPSSNHIINVKDYQARIIVQQD